MTERVQFVSQLKITVGGEPLEGEVVGKLVEVTVDQHTHLPHLFTIRLQDSDLQLLDEGPFDLAKEVEIAASSDEEGSESIVLLKGEITALEPEFNEGMIAELVVRGYDKSHRLYREVKSQTFLNIKDSDLATQIAQIIGLQAEVDATSIVYEHIYQHNQTDLAFLTQRAWRIGYECFVDENKLYFRKPVNSGSVHTLTWGSELRTFHPRMNVTEQVGEVMLKGWDAERQQPIIGKAESGRLYPKLKAGKDGADWASEFSPRGKVVIVDQPVMNQSEADLLATARLDEISGAFLTAEGVAFRSPELRAGKVVTLKGLGQRLSGDYLVTNATHRFTPTDGLITEFAVRGARTGLLIEQLTQSTPLDCWPGVVTAVVTNTEDPKGWGRVKVKFPWISEECESDWARLVGIGAGKEAGYWVLPEVGDEVVIAFTHGDFSQPVIIGGLWHGKAAPPPEGNGAPSGKKPLVRTWRSRNGHRITFYDTTENKIEVETKNGLRITLDDSSRTVEIKTQDLRIKADGNIEINANGQIKLKGATIDLN